MENDDWIDSRSIISPKKLHALGVMVLFWNSTEIGLSNLFQAVSDLPDKKSRVLIYDLQMPSLLEKIKLLIPDSGISDAATDAAQHALNLFDICRINRNQLTHFAPVGGTDSVEFWRVKGPEWTKKPCTEFGRRHSPRSGRNSRVQQLHSSRSATHFRGQKPD